MIAVFLALIETYTLCSLAYVAATATVATLVGLQLKEINIFIGPAIIQRKIGLVNCRLNWIPLGSGVRIEAASWKQANTLAKLCLILSGCACLLIIAATCVAGLQGLAMLRDGIGQVVLGGIAPLRTGSDLAKQAIEFTRNQGYLIVLGAMAAKICAYNLLPIPGLPGGQFLLTLWEKFVFPLEERPAFRTAFGGLLLCIALMASWAVAAGHALITYAW